MLRFSLLSTLLLSAGCLSSVERTGWRFEVDRPAVMMSPCVMQPQCVQYTGQGMAAGPIAQPMVIAGPQLKPPRECEEMTTRELCDRLLSLERRIDALSWPPKK